MLPEQVWMVYELIIIDNSFKSTASSLSTNPYLGLSHYEGYLSEVFNRLFFAAASTCFGEPLLGHLYS